MPVFPLLCRALVRLMDKAIRKYLTKINPS